jgi:hypothetical protein
MVEHVQFSAGCPCPRRVNRTTVRHSAIDVVHGHVRVDAAGPTATAAFRTIPGTHTPAAAHRPYGPDDAGHTDTTMTQAHSC